MDPTQFKIQLIRGDTALIIEDINWLSARISQWQEEGRDSASLCFALDLARFDAMAKIQKAALSKAGCELTQNNQRKEK